MQIACPEERFGLVPLAAARMESAVSSRSSVRVFLPEKRNHEKSAPLIATDKCLLPSFRYGFAIASIG